MNNELFNKPLISFFTTGARVAVSKLEEGVNRVKNMLFTRFVAETMKPVSITRAGIEALMTDIAEGETEPYMLGIGTTYLLTDATPAKFSLLIRAITTNTFSTEAFRPEQPGRVFHYDYDTDSIVNISSNQTFNKMFGRAELDYAGDLQTFGDSLTAGQGATDPKFAFVNILGARHRITIANYAIGGSGVWRAVKEAFGSIAFTNPVNSIFWMPGFNDIRRAGNNVSTFNKIRTCVNTLIANNFLTEVYAGSDPQVVKHSGTWVNVNAIAEGGKSNANAKSAITNSVSGSELRYDVNGDNLVIGVFGCDTFTTASEQGKLDIYVDTVLKYQFDPVGLYDGISDGSYNNTLGPAVIILTGLGSGLHNVRIVKTDNKPTWFDYVSQLIEPQNCKPVIIAETAYMSPAGLLVLPDNATNQDVDSENSLLLEIVEKWQPYPVFYVLTNGYTNLDSGIASDDIHWNDTNQFLMAKAIDSRL